MSRHWKWYGRQIQINIHYYSNDTDIIGVCLVIIALDWDALQWIEVGQHQQQNLEFLTSTATVQ